MCIAASRTFRSTLALHILVWLAVGAITGCSNNITGDKLQDLNDTLKGTKAISFSYFTNGENKWFKVSKQEDVMSVLASIHLKRVFANTSAGIKPGCHVEFHLSNGSTLRVFFVLEDKIEILGDGQVLLSDNKFFQRMCAIATEAEGKKIDLLSRDN